MGIVKKVYLLLVVFWCGRCCKGRFDGCRAGDSFMNELQNAL